MLNPKSYLLVTPMKNEENNLRKLVESVVKQKISPTLWIIVDDGSEDRGPEILKEMSKKYPFIVVVQFPEKTRWDIGVHYSDVCRYGFDKAVETAEKEGLEYGYIALLDADIILEPDYFKILMEEMENKNLGVASGVIYSWNGDRYIMDKTRDDLPRGAARVWTRECFEKSGGYLSTYSPDAVSNVKAQLKGYNIGLLKDVKAYQTRLTSSAMGRWTGFKKVGESVYFRHYPAYVAALRALSIASNTGIKESLAFIMGYFQSWVNRKPKLDDEEIKEYNRKRHRNMMKYWLGRN